ncbi:MAG: metal-binding protein [Herbaspirillum sp.]|jgi:dinuclear metal center YbgI/SA1388 family protein|nr:metal-binding protein [Herbaspirillum sp.]
MIRKTVDRDALVKYLAQKLNVEQYRDYCPNGLQVEGRAEIGSIVSGVTASLALIEAALDLKADAILVHHGYFWRGEDPRVVGIRQKRLTQLLAHQINLFAYHLPLDMHTELGNNAQLAKLLALTAHGRFAENDIGWLGRADGADLKTVGDLAARIERVLGRPPLVIGDPEQALDTIGWCTGAAQNMLADAIGAGADAYISGEISEPTVHLARESGVAYLAAGHHATERYGVQALGAHLAQQFGVQHRFVDIDNPV